MASIVVSWWAFAGAQGEGATAFGLFVGAASIMAMAWSFLLAVRVRLLEPLFGGLDSMYRAHRWAGALAVAAMFLHTQVAEPDIEGGIRGASKALADSAEDLAGTGETMLYILVGISLVRWVPYRWWRLTHKLLGIPYLVACWHFFTAEKPYANGSPWGWWFGAFMVVGAVAWLWRIVGRDAVRPGVRHRIRSAERRGSTTSIELEPIGRRRIIHRPGQFVFVKLDVAQMREPHPFSIASPPDADCLRFVIRDLGDWSRRLDPAALIGAEAVVEGPYGRFRPDSRRGRREIWVAGGVGITPFLGAIPAAPRPPGRRPLLFLCVRSRDDATCLDELEAAHADGRIELRVHASAEGDRLDPERLDVLVDGGLGGTHVAVCGPAALVRAVDRAARAAGAAEIHHEDFDIRQGFGPDLSVEIDDLVTSLANRR